MKTYGFDPWQFGHSEISFQALVLAILLCAIHQLCDMMYVLILDRYSTYINKQHC